MNRKLCPALCLAVLVCVISGVALPAEPVRGAIFTTLSDGSAVNANHFDSKCSVYLDGGPGPNAPAGAAGLPDGDYYFQVTDPGGKKLLSTDAVSNRRFRVLGGVIVAYTGVGGPPHPIGVDSDHPELGAITIQLANTTCGADFLDSPNNGGAYKVWATPVGDYVGNPANVDNECGNGCFHGFMPAKSKTDNFKAKYGTATFCVTMAKELMDAEGIPHPTAGWPIDLTDQLGVRNRYFTGASGDVQVCGLVAGTYHVQEDLQFMPGAIVIALIVNGEFQATDSVYSFTWTAGKLAPVILFRNSPDGGGGPQ